VRITTKSGDGGKTLLCSGKVISKCDLRIKAQGALDELISLLGMVRAKIKNPAVKKKIILIQTDLFKITASISFGAKGDAGAAVKDYDIRMLEHFGGAIEHRIRMPKTFVIPGVNEQSAILHIARAVSRRAECCVVELNRKFKVSPDILAYLNRLSDLLFILAVYEERKVKYE
jgi:cob(I)alamin adenosyltransferase